MSSLPLTGLQNKGKDLQRWDATKQHRAFQKADVMWCHEPVDSKCDRHHQGECPCLSCASYCSKYHRNSHSLNPSHSSMRLALLHARVTTEEMPAWFFSSRAGTWSHVGTALTAKPTRGRLDNRKIPVSGGVQGKGPRLHRSMLSPPKRTVHSKEPATCLGFPPN